MPQKPSLSSLAVDLFAITCIALALDGCATPLPLVNDLSTEQIAARVTRQVDPFRKMVTITGPEMNFRSGLATYQLAAFFPEADRSAISYRVLVSTSRLSSQGWAFWEQAFDADGTRIPTEKVRQDVIPGGTHELVTLSVSRDYLERIAKTGMTYRLDGRNDQLAFQIIGKEVTAFLAAADKL